MPRRSLEYNKLKALEDEKLSRLGQLQAMTRSSESAHWDPTSEIPGTGPEKRVYNMLIRLGVRFEFQYHLLDVDSTWYPEDVWVPDFRLPDYNVIIEVFGTYWHSLPSRRVSDLVKAAYHLHNGYMVIEHGIPTYPEGSWFGGKVLYWWDWEINMDLDHLFNRDLPEIFERYIPGEPEAYLLDAEAQKERIEAGKAAATKERVRPKIHPIETRIRKLRRQTFRLDKIYPYLRREEYYAPPKIPKRIYKRWPRT